MTTLDTATQPTSYRSITGPVSLVRVFWTRPRFPPGQAGRIFQVDVNPTTGGVHRVVNPSVVK